MIVCMSFLMKENRVMLVEGFEEKSEREEEGRGTWGATHATPHFRCRSEDQRYRAMDGEDLTRIRIPFLS